ncbi:AAA family ATPase [Brevibacillus laterosporus]|nr:RNA ligase [Brevibacillus laterosporus]MCR8994572.1 AAA family ATPase [Brevibacillus laterosporus]
MRVLVLLRGAMGAGKSTFVKNNKLEQYALSADQIRLLFQTPVQTEEGKETINSNHDSKVWKFLLELLEERMKRGEFTIIDATHAKQESITRYRHLATQYRYRVYVVDFSDIPLETLLEQNKMRPEYKHVPDHVIMNAHERMRTESIPKFATVIKPHEFQDVMQFTPTDYTNEYKKIHHIGDIQGCFDALMQYFEDTGHKFQQMYEIQHLYEDDIPVYFPILNDDELYIFVGDLLDRGIQNAEVLNFFLYIYKFKNVVLVEGNHEYHIWKWANDEEPVSNEFKNFTQSQLENQFLETVVDEVEVKQSLFGKIISKITGNKSTVLESREELNTSALKKYKKEVRQLYRKFRQLVYYTHLDTRVLVTHGGISKMPENLLYMSTEQFIKGVGDYECDIDCAWDKNVAKEIGLPIFIGCFETPFRGGLALDKDDIQEQNKVVYQIHGHRNIFRLPVKAGECSFNLEGQVEFGGHLRVVSLTSKGFQTHEIKNNVYKIRKGNVPSHMDEKSVTVENFMEYLANHEEIVEKPLGDNIYSYNFTRNAFKNKVWDDINIKARGLFINKETKEIVSRSYNKFFNVNERSFTKMNALADNLKFPVQVYDKPNGYLGTVGYNSETDSLVFTSKSEIKTEHADWLEKLFMKQFGEYKSETIKRFLKENNASLVFEVIMFKEDPHIIEYTENRLVLLDIVKREIVYSKLDYSKVLDFGLRFGVEVKELLFTFTDWNEFYKWYRDVTEDFSIKKEGYVIEDAVGFMTKIKLPYYNFWKQFRGIKDKFAKKKEYTVKGGSLYTPLHNKVFKWMKSQDSDYLKNTDIISIRKKFEDYTKAK